MISRSSYKNSIKELVQKFVPSAVVFAKNNKPLFKAVQQYTLTFIVYTVFCRTFSQPSNSSIVDILLMIVFQSLLLIFVTILAWYTFKFIVPNNPKLRVMALFGCTHKTVPTGIPLINAIYGNNGSVGLYTLPLLVWHPMQLVVGTFLIPYLVKYVETEQQRLNLDCNDVPIAVVEAQDTPTAAAAADDNNDYTEPNNNVSTIERSS